jgi:hypothetical protein
VVALASSPTAKADGHETEEAPLPEVFTPDADSTLDDETNSRLQAITGLHRLARIAADDEEMKLLMRGDPKEALSIIGVEVSDEFEIVVTSDAESGGDTATLTSEGFSNTQEFNKRGELSIESKSKSEFTSRGTNWDDVYYVWVNGGKKGNYVGAYFCGNPYRTADRMSYVLAYDYVGATHWYGYYDICGTPTSTTRESTTTEDSTTVDDTQCEDQTTATTDTMTTEEYEGSAQDNSRTTTTFTYTDCGGR